MRSNLASELTRCAARACTAFASTSWSIVLSSVSSLTGRFSRAFSGLVDFQPLFCFFQTYRVCSFDFQLQDPLRHRHPFFRLLPHRRNLFRKKTVPS